MNSIIQLFWAVVATVIIGGVIAVAVIFGLGELADSEAQLEEAKGRAQALVIEAQGQSRLDTAIAASVLSGAAIPWFAVVVVGAMFFGALIYLRSQPQQPQQAQYPPMIIERQVLLLHPGQAELMAAEWQRDKQRIEVV